MSGQFRYQSKADCGGFKLGACEMTIHSKLNVRRALPRRIPGSSRDALSCGPGQKLQSWMHCFSTAALVGPVFFGLGGDSWRLNHAFRRSGPTPKRSFTPRFSPYVLRHTCATLALLDGVDLLQVSRRLRHKTIAITAQFYGHVKAEHTTQAAENFDRLAAGVPSGSS